MAPEDETGMLPLHHPDIYPAAIWQREYLLIGNMIDPEQMLIPLILSKQIRPSGTITFNQLIGLIELTLEVLNLHLKQGKIIIRRIPEMDHRVTKEADQIRDKLSKHRNGLNCPPERLRPE